MGRIAEGWELVPKPPAKPKPGKNYRVRFTYGKRADGTGIRVDKSTGTRDIATARERAAAIYARIISGRTTPVAQHKSLLPLNALFAAWLESLEGVLAVPTVKTYQQTYVKTHFLGCFESLDDMTTGSLADYGRARLRKVTRRTVQKELGALREFLGWLREQDIWIDAPHVPPLPKRSKGKRVGTQREKAVEVPPELIEAILEALPEISARSGRRVNGEKKAERFPVRARFVLAWETGLRPATLNALRVPEHFHQGATTLTIADEIDKSRFGRELPLSERARAVLDAVSPAEGLIFGRHDYRHYLKTAAKDVKVRRSEEFAPYDFRHARALLWAESTTNLPAVSFLMGHRKVTTTALYVRGTQKAAAELVGGTPKKASA
jgi:site-specific recombinase XerD